MSIDCVFSDNIDVRNHNEKTRLKLSRVYKELVWDTSAAAQHIAGNLIVDAAIRAFIPHLRKDSSIGIEIPIHTRTSKKSHAPRPRRSDYMYSGRFEHLQDRPTPNTVRRLLRWLLKRCDNPNDKNAYLRLIHKLGYRHSTSFTNSSILSSNILYSQPSAPSDTSTSIMPLNISPSQPAFDASSLSIMPSNISPFQPAASETSTSIVPSNISPSQLAPSETSTSIVPSNISPSQPAPSDTSTSHIVPSNIRPSQPAPSDTSTSIVPSNIRPSQPAPSDTSTSIVLSNISPSQLAPSDTSTSPIVPSNIRPSQPAPSETSTSIVPSNISPSQPAPSETSTSIVPSNISPSQLAPSDTSTSPIVPSNISPSQPAPSDTSTSHIVPSNIRPSQPAPSDTSTSIVPSNIRPSQPAPSDTSTSIVLSNISPSQLAPSDTSTSPIVPSNIRPSQPAPSDTSTSIVLSNISPSQLAPSDTSTSPIVPSNIRPSQPAPSETSTSIVPSNISPSQLAPSDTSTSPIVPSNIRPSQPAPSDTSTLHIVPSNISPSQLAPSDASTLHIVPSNISPSQLAPSDASTSFIVSSNISHSQPAPFYTSTSIVHMPSSISPSQLAPSDPSTSIVHMPSSISPSQLAPSDASTSIVSSSISPSQLAHSDASTSSIVPSNISPSQPAPDPSTSIVHMPSSISPSQPAPSDASNLSHRPNPLEIITASKIPQPMTDYEVILETATQLLGSQDYSSVVQMLTDVEQSSWEPAELEADKNILLGIALMQLKRYDEAIAEFQKATQFAGSASYTYYCLIEIELVNHRPASVIHLFKISIKLYNDLSQHLFECIGIPKPSRCAMLTKLGLTQKNKSLVQQEFAALLKTASQLLKAQDNSLVVQILTDAEQSLKPDVELEAAKGILIGKALMQLKRYDEAILAFQKATQFAGSASYAHFCLGEINHCSASAADHFQEALKFYNALSQHLFELIDIPKPSLCVMHTKLAQAYENVDKVGDANQSGQKAIAARDQPTPAADLAAAHINLGLLLHRSIGDHTAAVPHFKKGIELSEQCSDMVSLMYAHGDLGNTFLSLSQHKQAFHHLQHSLDLTLEHEPTPTAIGRAYNNLGTYYQAVGDLDKAQDKYDTALGHGVYGQDQSGQARAYCGIGDVYRLKKNQERAIPHYNEVIRLSHDRLTTDTARHYKGCAHVELGGKKKVHTQCCSPQILLRGEVACEMESEHRCLSSEHYHHALKDLDKVIVGHDETFANIKGSSSGLNLSVAWFETNAKTFLLAQDCAYSIGDHMRALVYAEQCRARTLGELLNSKTGRHGDTFKTPLQSDSILSVVKHLKTPNVPVVVLSYTGTRLLVWVLVWDGEEVKMTAFEQEPKEEMFDGKTFDHYIRYSLSEMLTGGLQLYGGLEDQTVSDESPAAKLFELIGRPLLRILQEVMGCSGSRMVLIPDSYTKLLPFSALYDSKRQCFLGDSHSIVYSPSLLTLGVMSQMPPVDVHVPLDSNDMCVVGNPTTPPFKYNKEEWDLGSLPYATEEARSVAHMLQTTPLLHQEATKDAVLSKIRQAKVVHLATHGSAGGGFLVLGSSSHNFATVTKHTVEDPSTLLLHASELESMDIPPALVVLSSCDSGRGVIRGDDIQGMARSFLLAGARAVLTLLCETPDESANFFMQLFYRYLLDGHKASKALQKASHSIRCFAKYSNFVHWSGHQLTGQDVMVTHQLSSEERAVRASLGIDSTAFPRFDVLHNLTYALTNGSQTDVQLLCGPPGVDLVEPVTDFICSNYTHYPGGIVWLLNKEHSPLQELTESSNRVLIILGEIFFSVFLNLGSVDVIIISNGHAEETRHHVRSSLNRPVSVYEVKPLSELHATQRLVYSVQSSFHLPPIAADQSAFQQLAHLTMGSPILIRIVQYLLHHNMKHSNTPSEGLLNTVHSIEDMLDDDDVLSTSRLAIVSAVCSTLSTAAQRLLHCLSCLDGLPVPLECIENIANMIQPAGQPLVTELRQAAVLLGYPSPVVIPTTVQSQSPLLYVPVTVVETIWSASSLHNKALSLLLIKSAILKGPFCDTVCHQVLKSWETTMISDSQDSDSAIVLGLIEHFIEVNDTHDVLCATCKLHIFHKRHA